MAMVSTRLENAIKGSLPSAIKSGLDSVGLIGERADDLCKAIAEAVAEVVAKEVVEEVKNATVIITGGNIIGAASGDIT